jgi:hypothetical protein
MRSSISSSADLQISSGRQKNLPPPNRRRPMNDPNRLGQMILKHWQDHHPKMLAELQSKH